MEIVIELPEARYRAIKDVCKIAGWPMDWEAIFRDVFFEGLFRDVFWAIDGGRVLQKGHGRLIDGGDAK